MTATTCPQIMFLRLFRSHFQIDFPLYLSLQKRFCPITFTCSASNKMLKAFTTLGVSLESGGSGEGRNAKCFGPFGTNAALCRIEEQQSRERPWAALSASAMTILALAPLPGGGCVRYVMSEAVRQGCPALADGARHSFCAVSVLHWPSRSKTSEKIHGPPHYCSRLFFRSKMVFRRRCGSPNVFRSNRRDASERRLSASIVAPLCLR